MNFSSILQQRSDLAEMMNMTRQLEDWLRSRSFLLHRRNTI